mgnify:CR=1 FL=1|jgi:hypothetical protein
MDPISIGVAAAVLLASKFGEGLATDAGTSAWQSTKRLYELVTTKFKGDHAAESAVAMLTTTPTEDSVAMVADLITTAIQADRNFGSEVEGLVSRTNKAKSRESFYAQAFEHAKQVNIRGDNCGQINL